MTQYEEALGHAHDWQETGERHKHVEGAMFKYGTSVVTYVRCKKCLQKGFRYDSNPIVFTWKI